MKARGFVTAVTALCIFAGLARAQANGWEDMLEKRTYKDKDDKTLPYRLLKPDNYDAKEKYPLVLFLHGAGECGTDNKAQLKNSVVEFTKAENRKKHPCFLAVPQCPSTRVGWSDFRSKTPGKQPSDAARLALEIVAALQKEFSIDANRLYITGLSMGGYGTWDIITRHPDSFAAAVPVCGGGDSSQAEKIAKIPIWAFHGGKDPVVPPARSKEMIEAIKKAGGEAKYTEYPDVGHNSWVKAYQDTDMMAWLFAQKRK
ncbi:MAG TPA: prolyl oligopeptidase family serine peptidase [Gemmataceae bacterium]|nr:prolyl oligopeptidase family serine peptidase [Gemmataceae bacterium]